MSSPTTLAVLAVCFSVFCVFAIGYGARRLASNFGSDVRVVWWLFSLTATATFLVAWWAVETGAIDGSGGFHGRAGSVLQSVLKGVLDLEASLKVYGALVALFVVPQLASWLLSGLSGCASAPVLIGAALRIFFWSIVKSLVVASGAIAAVVSFGRAYGWAELTNLKMASHAASSLGLLTLAFSLLYIYRDLYEAKPASELTAAQRTVGLAISKFNAWMNRSIRPL